MGKTRQERQAESHAALRDRPCQGECGNYLGVERWNAGERLCSRCAERAERQQRIASREDLIDYLMEHRDALERLIFREET